MGVLSKVHVEDWKKTIAKCIVTDGRCENPLSGGFDRFDPNAYCSCRNREPRGGIEHGTTVRDNGRLRKGFDQAQRLFAAAGTSGRREKHGRADRGGPAQRDGRVAEDAAGIRPERVQERFESGAHGRAK